MYSRLKPNSQGEVSTGWITQRRATSTGTDSINWQPRPKTPMCFWTGASISNLRRSPEAMHCECAHSSRLISVRNLPHLGFGDPHQVVCMWYARRPQMRCMYEAKSQSRGSVAASSTTTIYRMVPYHLMAKQNTERCYWQSQRVLEHAAYEECKNLWWKIKHHFDKHDMTIAPLRMKVHSNSLVSRP